MLALNWVRQALEPISRYRSFGALPGPGRQRAHYERLPPVIAVPLHRGDGPDGRATAWALRELVVLHEISHHLAQEDEVDHGPLFTGRMVELVDGVIGPEAAFLLRVTLQDVGAQVG